MLKTRDAVLLYQESETDSFTRILDINIPDPISAFYLEVRCPNGATSNKGNYISDIVTKVEVVDGSEVLCSLNWFELEALYFYKTGRVPAMFPSELASGNQLHGCYLLFGRYLWDPIYALQPRNYRNPQLKVTFNKAAVRAASATGFADATNIKLTVVAKVMEAGATIQGYLMQKEIDSFTSAASGDKRIDLPTDYPYRMLLMRAYIQLKDIDEVISDIKMTVDTDKVIPFNRKVMDLDREAYVQFGTGRLKHDIITQHQAAFRLLFNKEPSLLVYPWEDASPPIIGVRYTWSSEGKLDLTDNAGTLITTDQAFTCVEEGHALHAVLPVPFGRLMEPDTWFQVTGANKVELVLTQAAASAVCQIFLEQVRP